MRRSEGTYFICADIQPLGHSDGLQFCRELPARAGVATTNGVGELTKKLEIDEWGIVQTAIYLCGTHALGIVYHGAILPDQVVAGAARAETGGSSLD